MSEVVGAIEVKVAKDVLELNEAGTLFYIPGGGTHAREDGGEFNVRTLSLKPDQESASGVFASGLPIVPFGFVILEAAAEASLAGKRLRLTLETVDA